MFINTRPYSALATSVTRKGRKINIILDNNFDFLPCYATHDQIRGHVELSFDNDVTVEDLIISLEGESITYVDKTASTTPTAARTRCKHTFLRMSQPIKPDALLEGGVAKAGVSYTIPFKFIVPERLLPSICSHRVDSDRVKQMHVELPPSLGNQSCTYEGQPFMEDFVPDRAKITYSICAKAAERTPPNQTLDWVESREIIRIVPARSEEPPIDVGSSSVGYALCAEKSVKKGRFKIRKTGKLIAVTNQPRSLHLPHPHNVLGEPVTTLVTVNLRFDPVNIDDDQPPILGNIAGKLNIYTFFGATTYSRFVEPHQAGDRSTMYGMHLESIDLSSRSSNTVSWTRQGSLTPTACPTDASQPPSSLLTSAAGSLPGASSIYKEGSPFYTSSVSFPFSLPTMHSLGRRNMFLPTFHSCRISRIYTVDLKMYYHTADSNVAAEHIVLKLPVQVSAEGGNPPGPEIGSEEAIASEIERQFRLGETLSDEPLEPEAPVYEEIQSPHPRLASPESGAPPEYRTHANGQGANGTGTPSELSFTSTRRATVTRKSLASLAIFAISGIDID